MTKTVLSFAAKVFLAIAFLDSLAPLGAMVKIDKSNLLAEAQVRIIPPTGNPSLPQIDPVPPGVNPQIPIIDPAPPQIPIIDPSPPQIPIADPAVIPSPSDSPSPPSTITNPTENIVPSSTETIIKRNIETTRDPIKPTTLPTVKPIITTPSPGLENPTVEVIPSAEQTTQTIINKTTEINLEATEATTEIISEANLGATIERAIETNPKVPTQPITKATIETTKPISINPSSQIFRSPLPIALPLAQVSKSEPTYFPWWLLAVVGLVGVGTVVKYRRQLFPVKRDILDFYLKVPPQIRMDYPVVAFERPLNISISESQIEVQILPMKSEQSISQEVPIPMNNCNIQVQSLELKSEQSISQEVPLSLSMNNFRIEITPEFDGGELTILNDLK